MKIHYYFFTPGASKQLGTIIEGESLLNDGAAMVLFQIFLEMSIHAKKTGNALLGVFNYVTRAYGIKICPSSVVHLSVGRPCHN